jgi:hypothetical protein
MNLKKKCTLGAKLNRDQDNTDHKHQDGDLIDPVHYLDIEVDRVIGVWFFEAEVYEDFCDYLHKNCLEVPGFRFLVLG